MEPDITTAIERWFAEHAEEENGDFVRADRLTPYFVIPPLVSSRKVVYTTKSHGMVAAVAKSESSTDFGVIGRHGLPCESDVAWIHDIVGTRSLWFLGDLDPADLLIFAWLRARVAPQAVQHLGVSDRFLQTLWIEATDRLLIRMAPSERDALPLLDIALPDWRTLVGARCTDLLQAGRKFEVEAAMHGPHGVAGLLLPLAND